MSKPSSLKYNISKDKNMKHTSFLQKKQNDIMLINRPISKILTLDTFKKDIIYSAANFVNIVKSVL